MRNLSDQAMSIQIHDLTKCVYFTRLNAKCAMHCCFVTFNLSVCQLLFYKRTLTTRWLDSIIHFNASLSRKGSVWLCCCQDK